MSSEKLEREVSERVKFGEMNKVAEKWTIMQTQKERSQADSRE